jgi:hypothetical protein
MSEFWLSATASPNRRGGACQAAMLAYGRQRREFPDNPPSRHSRQIFCNRSVRTADFAVCALLRGDACAPFEDRDRAAASAKCTKQNAKHVVRMAFDQVPT